ncbi:sulfotransferase-like domain-containing protein [Pontibaca salina]|uniref:HAD family hydrolase n=1 Tax=Pontibaca salina TaxID=2795731 RepID=A0A934HPT7_9RHOB|nr:HAD family hydrolase [Pontibaca salina]MBI6630976.1 HAD family hydrolase [Pontibaca salina]
MNIAMWSGPRNLSTAMMYSFGNRPDFEAMDEPFYAAYLKAANIRHPMHAQVMETQESDPIKVAETCAAAPVSARHRYMKHMAHHMLEGMPLDWAKTCINIHLIRHPARVIASYAAKRENATLLDIGYAQQTAVYEKLGGLVIDSHDIRESPEAALRSLCAAIDLPFSVSMLRWPAGPKPFDGVWASHWYGAVHRSNGFAGPEGILPQLEGEAADLCAQALPHYEALKAQKLKVSLKSRYDSA